MRTVLVKQVVRRQVKTRANPNWLLAELSYRCPLQCAYCSNPVEISQYQDEIDTLAWKNVLVEARELGCVQVGFSGGEPLVRNDLEELVLTANGLGYYTNLITSGVGLTEKRIRQLKKNGLDSIQISFQSHQSDLNDYIAGNDVYRKKIETAHLIKQYDFPLTFNIVLHRTNIDSIREILDFAFTFKPDFIELANTQYSGGFAFQNRDYLLPSLEQVTNAKDVVDAYPKGDTGVIYVFPDYYQGRPKACMGGWGVNFVVVTPDGAVLPCLSARTLPGLQIPNVKDGSLEDIWNTSEMFSIFRGDSWMKDPCRTCPERFTDFGGCRCQAYLLTGDKFATDPVCSLSPQNSLITDFVKQPRSDDFVFRNFETSKKIVEDGNGGDKNTSNTQAQG
jgi:pyrroloquinoline quinone biosynthesis protein E